MRGIPWPAKELVASQEKLCSKQLTCWLVSTSPVTINSFRIFGCNLLLLFKHFAVDAASGNMASGVGDVSLEMTILFAAMQAISTNFVAFAIRSPI
jgi:hypothetical protein